MKKYKKSDKIFVISLQKNGTTSTGKFLKDHGFKLVNWHKSYENNWPFLVFNGEIDKVLNSKIFRKHNAFEDEPWWYNGVYRYLFHKFPKAKFILINREPNSWYNSLLNHNNNKSFGNSFVFARNYNLDDELVNNSMLESTGFSNENNDFIDLKGISRQHFIDYYQARKIEIIQFFNKNGKERLFTGQLEDKMLWKKMGDFLEIEVDSSYVSHLNSTENIEKTL